MIFAYFGPEMQMPLTSILGAISGILLLFGAAPVRRVKQWLRKINPGNKQP